MCFSRKKKSYWDIMRSRFFFLLFLFSYSAFFCYKLYFFFVVVIIILYTQDATWVAWNVDNNSSKVIYIFSRTRSFIYRISTLSPASVLLFFRFQADLWILLYTLNFYMKIYDISKLKEEWKNSMMMMGNIA
jgi:hypothetical protein